MIVQKIIFSLLIFSFTIFFTGCEDRGEESPILVFLTPEVTLIEANSKDRVFITVRSSTSTGSSLNLKIESMDDEYGIQNLFDSTFNSQSINYRYEYIVPSYPDSTQSLLIFTLNNELKQTTEIAKRILINRGESFVKEASGVTIYSSASTRPNAFSLEDFAPGFSADTATFQSDFLDGTEMENDTLSRMWISNSGLSFVKFDGFNYANATSASIRNAYDNGVKLTRISDIRGSGIYLIGNGDNALGAIQIIAVTDPEGVQEDKYTFSIKAIEN